MAMALMGSRVNMDTGLMVENGLDVLRMSCGSFWYPLVTPKVENHKVGGHGVGGIQGEDGHGVESGK